MYSKTLCISLFGVGVNILNNKLTNTTTNMQYCIDNGDWTDCLDNETTITGTLKDKSVIKVRQKDNTSNEYTVATITQPNFPNEVVVTSKATDEESHSDTILELTGENISFEDYKYYIGSSKPDDTAIWKAFEDSSQKENSISQKVKDLQDSDITIYVRKKAITDAIASNYTSIDIIRGFNSEIDTLKQVTLDLTTPSEPKLSGTTSNMQYAIKKKDATNSDTLVWNDCNSSGDITSITKLSEGDTVIVRQKNKTSVQYTVGQVQSSPTESDVSGSDGTIVIPAGMEYGKQESVDGKDTTKFTKINEGNEGTLTIDKPGVYEVRKSMTDTEKAGEYILLTVKGQLSVTSGENMTFVEKQGESSNIKELEGNKYIYTNKELVKDTIELEVKADDGYIFTSNYKQLDENDKNNDGIKVTRS